MTLALSKFSGLTAVALASAGIATTAVPIGSPAAAQSQTGGRLLISSGTGKQINLTSSIADVVVADPSIADVDVKSPRQIYIFGKKGGETNIYATDARGRTVYTVTVRVGDNIESLDQMIALAMPGAEIRTTTMNGVILLTGTVESAVDAQEAQSLVEAFVGKDMKVVSRLKTAMPMQVNLRVRIAEVSRSLAKEINSNLMTRDTTNGFLFGVTRGRNIGSITDFNTAGMPKLDASSIYGLPPGTISLPFDPKTGNFVTGGASYNFNAALEGKNVLTTAGRLFGLDIGAAFDLSERAGLTTTLAEPNLTTVSGEAAEFLAGGEFPIPVSSGLGSTSLEYKQYGVSLSYTPTVLSNGRISLRVRPEVSDISSQGAVTINGFSVPATITRRAETTVELGSGQSFMIAGLLSNSMNSDVEKMPGAGDIPILGALFKSNGWRKNETELMIVVTPYLVKPVSDSEIALPTDGYRSPTDLERVLMNKQTDTGGDPKRPMPTVAPAGPAGPEFGATQQPPALPRDEKADSKNRKQAEAGSPGFSFN